MPLSCCLPFIPRVNLQFGMPQDFCQNLGRHQDVCVADFLIRISVIIETEKKAWTLADTTMSSTLL